MNIILVLGIINFALVLFQVASGHKVYTDVFYCT